MVSSYLPCLTERFLLNNHILDWIYPVNCKKNRINQIGSSALKALVDSKKDIYSNYTQKNQKQWIAKSISTIRRVLYIGVVTLTIAPIGVV